MAEKKASKSAITGVAQVRQSRPTNQLPEILRFYCAGLGLDLLLQFEKDKAGYGGAILGVPGTDYHLEFVTHMDGFTGEQIRPPTEDHLLVFFLEGSLELDAIRAKLEKMGSVPVPAKNPHWDLDGVTYEDPDGWRIVLMMKRNI